MRLMRCQWLVVVLLSLLDCTSSAVERKSSWRRWRKRVILRGGDLEEESTTLPLDHLQNQTLENETSVPLKHTLLEKKQEFLDRIALVATLLRRDEAASLVLDNETAMDETAITPQSDLTRPGRHIHVVTTAALPWMTGTAVNPLLRAAYLHRYTQDLNDKASKTKQSSWVTLVIPWLELPEDQQELYHRVFETPREQEDYIREWLSGAGLDDAARDLQILFYPARYHSGLGSVFAMGDICALIPREEADFCVLEEPEHCNWFRAPGDGWTQKFNFVVGVVHTNYKEYASSHYSGLWTAPAISLVSSAMVRAYCHQVIKLSDVLQTFAPEKERTFNVHGVRPDFLQQEGKRKDDDGRKNEDSTASAYFIGKLLWAKGLDLMLELEEYYKECTGDYFQIDVYGSGPDEKDIKRAFHRRWKRNGERSSSAQNATEIGTNMTERVEELGSNATVGSDESSLEKRLQKAKQQLEKIKETIKSAKDSIEIPKTFHELRPQPIPATFPGRVDHASLKNRYRVFVNPSVSEVLCTTTAEALAMGKFAIVPVHPSNAFFLPFPNCLGYRNRFEFVANLHWALTHEPEPLTPELAREFTWEAATERFIRASAITWKEAREREKLGLTKRDERIAWLHKELGKGPKGDVIRKMLGAGPASEQVKYQTEKLREAAGEVEEDEDEDEDDGLSAKFRRSSFAQAIREALAKASPPLGLA